MTRALTVSFSFLAVLLMAIAACSPLNPRDQGRSFMFTLDSVKPPARTRYDGTLIVDHPTARIELDTYRVALIRPDGAFDYYARTRWVDFISPMVLDAMVPSLEDANLFTDVQAESSAFGGDYVLKSEIREFNAVYTAKNEPPEIHIAIACNLLKGDRKTRIAAFTATGTATASENALEAIHDAFNTAFAAAQKSMATQIARAMKAAKDAEDTKNEAE